VHVKPMGLASRELLAWSVEVVDRLCKRGRGGHDDVSWDRGFLNVHHHRVWLRSCPSVLKRPGVTSRRVKKLVPLNLLAEPGNFPDLPLLAMPPVCPWPK